MSSTAVGQTERLALEMCRVLRDPGYEANISTFYFNERARECADLQQRLIKNGPP